MQINSFTATGNIGRDPEPKYFESGSVVAKTSIAVNKNTSKKDEKPSWFEIECWGKTAEVLTNYCKKGSKIGVTGSIYPQAWTGKDGIPASGVTIKVESLTLLDKKSDNTSASDSSAASAESYSYDDF